ENPAAQGVECQPECGEGQRVGQRRLLAPDSWLRRRAGTVLRPARLALGALVQARAGAAGRRAGLRRTLAGTRRPARLDSHRFSLALCRLQPAAWTAGRAGPAGWRLAAELLHRAECRAAGQSAASAYTQDAARGRSGTTRRALDRRIGTRTARLDTEQRPAADGRRGTGQRRADNEVRTEE